MKYYLSRLYDEIKEEYFKNFAHMRINNQILNATFTSIMFGNLKPTDTVNEDDIEDFKLMISDYENLTKLETYDCQSQFMLNIQDELLEAQIILGSYLRDISTITLEVMTILKTASAESCLVGGACRDALDMDVDEPKDYDFATDVLYDELERLFKDEGFRVKETGKHTLVLTISKNNETFEIANFRKDGTYEDGRRPSNVTIGTIEDDGRRRDFTCNAIYYNLTTENILDISGLGISDCFTKTLRSVGNADDRMSEDLLRIMRAYRFIGKGYTPYGNLLAVCRKNFNDMIINISSERIRMEVEKMVHI